MLDLPTGVKTKFAYGIAKQHFAKTKETESNTF